METFLFILSFALLIKQWKYKYWARITVRFTYWIYPLMLLGMATFMAAGVFLICRGMLIASEHAWTAIAVPAIIISLVCSEAALLVRMPQGTEDGDDQHLLRDLVMKSVDVSIRIYKWASLIVQQPNYPWKAEMILNLVGGGLSVLIGAYQIACILYNMGIMSVVDSDDIEAVVESSATAA